MDFMLIVTLLLSLLFALICGFIAARRGGNRVYWTVMGFVFGPFAVPFALKAKAKSSP